MDYAGFSSSGQGVRNKRIIVRSAGSKSRRGRARRQIYVPKHMTKKQKHNLKMNLVTLGEKKYVPRPQSLQSVGFDTMTGAFVNDITNITIGDNDTNRDGDQFGIRSIECNWSWIAGDSTNICRFVVFQWFPNTTPTLSSIFQDISVPTYAPLSPYDHDGRFNFKILLDVKTAVSTYGPGCQVYRKYITSGFKKKVQLVGGGLSGNNKIYVLGISDSGTTTHPGLTYFIKVNYNDY